MRPADCPVSSDSSVWFADSRMSSASARKSFMGRSVFIVSIISALRTLHSELSFPPQHLRDHGHELFFFEWLFHIAHGAEGYPALLVLFGLFSAHNDERNITIGGVG